MAEQQHIPRPSKVKDLTGVRSGRLIVVEFSHVKDERSFWRCKCDCGRMLDIRSDGISTGHAKSCGCLHRDEMIQRQTKHGKARTPEYNAWVSMLRRCTNPIEQSYPRYGGRGIRVCERWLTLENFLTDMGKRPTPNHSIDRIDNDGHYEPGNCRWTTSKVQMRNRSSARLISFRGKTQCLSAWAEETGISVATLDKRLDNWSIEKSLTHPVQRYRKSIE